MTTIAFFAAVSLFGIDVGWQPTPDGGVEYIIQIPPGAIESLRDGEAFQSDIPPEVLRDLRTYRIIVGNTTLPRKLPERPAGELKAAAEKGPAAEQKTPEKSATAMAAPAPLPSNPASKPMIGQPADFVEEMKPAAATTPESAKPWLPLWLTAVALFASLGANVYLGWIAIDVRRRWRTLVEKTA